MRYKKSNNLLLEFDFVNMVHLGPLNKRHILADIVMDTENGEKKRKIQF